MGGKSRVARLDRRGGGKRAKKRPSGSKLEGVKGQVGEGKRKGTGKRKASRRPDASRRRPDAARDARECRARSEKRMKVPTETGERKRARGSGRRGGERRGEIGAMCSGSHARGPERRHRCAEGRRKARQSADASARRVAKRAKTPAPRRVVKGVKVLAPRRVANNEATTTRQLDDGGRIRASGRPTAVGRGAAKRESGVGGGSQRKERSRWSGQERRCWSGERKAAAANRERAGRWSVGEAGWEAKGRAVRALEGREMDKGGEASASLVPRRLALPLGHRVAVPRYEVPAWILR